VVILSHWIVLAYVNACRYVVFVCVCLKCCANGRLVFTVWYSITVYCPIQHCSTVIIN